MFHAYCCLFLPSTVHVTLRTDRHTEVAKFISLFWPTLWRNGYSDSGVRSNRRDSLDWSPKARLFAEVRSEYEGRSFRSKRRAPDLEPVTSGVSQ